MADLIGIIFFTAALVGVLVWYIANDKDSGPFDE